MKTRGNTVLDGKAVFDGKQGGLSPVGLLDTADPPGYRLVSKLGEGGFGTVFRAVQESTGQIVALKMCRPDTDLDERCQQRRIERFELEMQLCAELSHPYIVKLLDKGRTQDGQLFAVFEYVPGETLRELLLRRGPLSAPEAGELMGQVLDALACAHAHGVVHRDLKPQNIMVSTTGARSHIKVLDFGIGAFQADRQQADDNTLTMRQEVVGTPSYSAPEQLRGEPPTTKSDLYAWGLVFLECLTGQLAIRGGTSAEICHQQLNPTEVTLPPEIAGHPLADVLRMALRKAPLDRAEHAAQIYADLTPLNLASLTIDLGPRGRADVQDDDPFSETLEHVDFGRVLQSEYRQATVWCCDLPLHLNRDIELEAFKSHLDANGNVTGAVLTLTGGRRAEAMLFLRDGTYPCFHVNRGSPLAGQLSNTFDFNQGVQGVLFDGYGGPAGLVTAKHVGVHAVHSLEIPHIFQVDRGLCDVC